MSQLVLATALIISTQTAVIQGIPAPGRSESIDLLNALNFDQILSLNGTGPSSLGVGLEDPKWIDEWVAPAEIRNWFPYYVAGYDEDGAPFYVVEYGNWKFVEALADTTGGPAKLKELFMKYLEQGVLRAIRDGMANNSQGVSGILDWNGFSLSNYANVEAIQLGLQPLAMLSRIYNVLNYGIFINTNFAAENFLRIARPVMGNILEKCEIFGSQKTKWLPSVLKKISKGQLPPWYGGEEHWKPVSVGGLALKQKWSLSTNASESHYMYLNHEK